MADWLSGGRLVLACVFPWVLGGGGWLPIAMFAVAAITDYIDGPLARASGRPSPWGGVLDNTADIAFVLGGACTGVALGLVWWPVPAAIIASVTGYVLATRRQSQPGTTVVLARSRVGHVAGVINYVLAGAIAARQSLPALIPVELVTAVSWATLIVNLTAVGQRLRPR